MNTSIKELEGKVWNINVILGYNTKPYSQNEIRVKANLGTFFIEKVKGGYSLNQVERGGSKEIIRTSTTKELEFILVGMEKGVHAFEFKY